MPLPLKILNDEIDIALAELKKARQKAISEALAMHIDLEICELEKCRATLTCLFNSIHMRPQC